ncbi:MAG: glucosaminidase domain-containing protein [Pseudohongiella sp.]|nr:glucosaminidase domain-containing protein [Pseudohongiella sp.]
MNDFLRHPRLSWLARGTLVAALGAFTFTAWAQYRQSPQISVLPDFVTEIVEQEQAVSELPDFESYVDTQARKEAFFNFLTAYVEKENQGILRTRAALEPMWQVVSSGQRLSDVEYLTLLDIAEQYRLDAAELSERQVLAELMKRVDIIPTSLVLAQAANESAWGMSRFAREGNNIFGQWCFDAGCGLVPARRGQNATHEVRSFASIEASVNAYFLNLNTNSNYQDMREMRAQMRVQNRPLDSLVLARGLTRYSQRGMAYVSELQDIIRVNKLGALDRS